MARIREPDYSVKWMAANAPAELQAELIREYSLDLRDNAKMEAPYQSGALVNSIVAENGRVVAKAEHALYVHEGTRPHMIYPRSPGGMLSWVQGGVRRFARHVHHPGNAPNPFMKRGLERTRRESPRITQQVMDRWLWRHRVR